MEVEHGDMLGDGPSHSVSKYILRQQLNHMTSKYFISRLTDQDRRWIAASTDLIGTDSWSYPVARSELKKDDIEAGINVFIIEVPF